MNIFCNQQNNQSIYKSAFSLVEILIVLALLFIMTGISLNNYDRFGREVELENAAYELALTVRQAQFFGINRSEQFGATFDNPQPYGIFFDLDGFEQGMSDQSFVMFIDNNLDRQFAENDNNLGGNELCNENPSDECISLFTFNRSVFISSICMGADELSCTDLGSIGSGVRVAHISFKRPNPDAEILHDNNTTPYAYARITLSSPVAEIPSKSISIGAAGLISID